MRRTRSALQRLDRAGHGEIGLARARRADAEGQIVRADVRQIVALVSAARANAAARNAHDPVTPARHPIAGPALALPQRQMHALGCHLFACSPDRTDSRNVSSALCRARADDPEAIAAAPDLRMPSRDSSSRRFSSSGPHRFASRALSGGSRSNSRAVRQLSSHCDQALARGGRGSRPRRLCGRTSVMTTSTKRLRSGAGRRSSPSDCSRCAPQARAHSFEPAARRAPAARCRPCLR